MASVSVHAYTTQKNGLRRWKVLYRLRGRDCQVLHGGSFKRKADADARAAWIREQLRAGITPDPLGIGRDTAPLETVAELMARWQASRIDVSEATRVQHRSAVRRLTPDVLETAAQELTPARIAAMVALLAAKGYARESIRKTRAVLAMALDFADFEKNAARDRRVKLPREIRDPVTPPDSATITACIETLAPAYRLPTLLLDATGMRLNELMSLTWADMNEPHSRFRIRPSNEKTRRGRFVEVPSLLFEAVAELTPRDDRHPDRRVFQHVTGDRLRTAISRACVARGVPVFSPHDLRHRRVSLLHLRGVPWARIGEHVGQTDIATTANTYTHVLADETELDYAALLGRER